MQGIIACLAKDKLKHFVSIYIRFKCINDATRLRMTPGYSNDVDVVELVEFFNTKTTSCESLYIVIHLPT